jgi:hypothetical protein
MPADRNAYFRDYYQRRIEVMRAYKAKWGRENRESVMATQRKWREKMSPEERETLRQRRAQQNKEWRAFIKTRDPELWQYIQRKYALRRNYGLTPEAYEAMLKAQGGKCAICRRPPEKRKHAVDHCHKTNTIRGLLCHRCNRALGYLDDDPLRLRAAISYLRQSERFSMQFHR